MNKNLKNIVLGLVCMLVSSQSFAQDIEILHADSMYFDKNMDPRFMKLEGNVRFKHDTTLMFCDLAMFDVSSQLIKAKGKIYMNQADSVYLKGEKLDYDGKTKIAHVFGNVELWDDQMKLTTPSINYNLNTKVGHYTKGGKIVNGENILTSQIGYYYANINQLNFRKNVHLVNPQYDMTSDTLIYNTVSKIAWFYGPTEINSEDNKITCNYGWYNTRTEHSQFSKSVVIHSKENIIASDSMVYYRNTGLGKAFGNLWLRDTAQDFTLEGDYGFYNRIYKTSLITAQNGAVGYKLMKDGNDTMFLKADTFYFEQDSITGRVLSAYRNVKVFKIDMQATCDSLVYAVIDSTIKLIDKPIMWNDSSQITGDSIDIFLRNNKLHLIKVTDKAFLISHEGHGKYNQIKGKNMFNHFVDGELKVVDVLKNAQIIYYDKNDSGKFTGIYASKTTDLKIELDSSKIEFITLKGKSDGGYYPPKEFPKNKEKLPSFSWKIAQKPSRKLYKIDHKRGHKLNSQIEEDIKVEGAEYEIQEIDIDDI